jgi:hypothetical protein
MEFARWLNARITELMTVAFMHVSIESMKWKPMLDVTKWAPKCMAMCRFPELRDRLWNSAYNNATPGQD